jgi:hypothetical protein
VVPTKLVLGVGALLDDAPPVATVYHFSVPPVEIVAVKAKADKTAEIANSNTDLEKIVEFLKEYDIESLKKTKQEQTIETSILIFLTPIKNIN